MKAEPADRGKRGGYGDMKKNAEARFAFCGALKPIVKILSVIKTQSELCERRGFSAEHKCGSCWKHFL